MMKLDIQLHRYPTRDGRFFSTPETADYIDGKIDERTFHKLASIRFAEQRALAGGSGSKGSLSGEVGHKDVLPSAKENSNVVG